LSCDTSVQFEAVVLPPDHFGLRFRDLARQAALARPQQRLAEVVVSIKTGIAVEIEGPPYWPAPAG